MWTQLFRAFLGFGILKKLSLQFSPFSGDKDPCIHCGDDEDKDHDEEDDHNNVDDDGYDDDNHNDVSSKPKAD